MATYYIGWDVGAWYCDGNKGSQDALVIYKKGSEDNLPTFKGCIRQQIFSTNCIAEFLNVVFKTKDFSEKDNFFLAIDAVFGFPNGINLLLDGKSFSFPEEAKKKGNAIENPLLYRFTERFIARTKKKRPFSVIQNSIGSQSTKVIFFLQHFQFKQEEIGVWKNANSIAIETYPSILGIKGNDIDDAHLCAKLAKTFATAKGKLYSPSEDSRKEYFEIIKTEGWIWFPKE